MEVLLLSTDQGRSVIRDSATSRSYSPFGVLLSDVAEDSSVKFNGQRLERIARHYLLGNGYRAYSPSLTRFNSPDSQSPFGEGGLNAYMYLRGDPINYRDPSGHIPEAKVLQFWGPDFDLMKAGQWFQKNKIVTGGRDEILRAVGETMNLERRAAKIIASYSPPPRLETLAFKSVRRNQAIYRRERVPPLYTGFKLPRRESALVELAKVFAGQSELLKKKQGKAGMKELFGKGPLREIDEDEVNQYIKQANALVRSNDR